MSDSPNTTSEGGGGQDGAAMVRGQQFDARRVAAHSRNGHGEVAVGSV